ncbi:C-type mannose receptor 2-like [Chelmon rostratus]|uniref:C-type mannose receptor 2-like n=1 Tax=Chelmon rostratus TaxID=109905 RepID=UPI001BE64C8A|nr:C-type mannose receptor 2-like [Chelmon rostratus]
MQRSLFLLLLMGQCSFFMCHLCEYHFISDSKTWEEARNYCRETYTDLATVYDMMDAERLSVPTGRQEGAWIGLQSHPGKENRRWHWSLPGVEHHEAPEWWADGEPNGEQLLSFENCVLMHNDKWMDQNCECSKPFICYNDETANKKLYFINKSMTWPEAQSHCRKNHTDLVSGITQLNDDEFKAERKNETFVWIGRFRDTWRWSDNSSSSFRNWDLELFRDDEEQKCAVIKFNGTGKWSSDDCHEEKPFFCYEDKVVLIQQNKTWEEALNHCRENHNDLVSITNRNEQMWVRQKAKRASSPYVWLGLRYTCTLDFWFWVSDEEVGYENWASSEETDDCDLSGAMSGGGEHKWSKKADTDKFNFICSNF